MIAEYLENVLPALPLHAEEGSLREVIAEDDLIAAMTDSSGELEAARITLDMLHRIFEMLNLLDPVELENHCWAFVSFPASLVARSLIESMASPGQALFPHNYWEQGAHRPAKVVEEQRNLLHELESRRERFHPQNNPNPIRVVHVAWGMIKLGTDFLLVHRDDKTRAMRNYVFPGGRLNMDDCTPELRTVDTLRELFSVNSAIAEKILPNTFYRELEEELGLLQNADYSATDIGMLTPYRKLEGARNNHACSAYNFMLFAIQLTEEGNLKILDQMANEPEYIAQFSIQNLAQGRRPDGKTAFVDIFRSNYSQAMPKVLAEMPDSSAFEYRYTIPTEAIDIPLHPQDALLKGKTGKEKAVPFTFNREQLDVVLLLAWHARGFPVSGCSSTLQLLGGGWVKIMSDELLNITDEIINLTSNANLPLLDFVANTYVRLSYATHLINFIGSDFSYALKQLSENKGTLTVALPERNTDIATLESVVVDISVNRNTMRVITAIENGVDPETDETILSEDLDRDLRQKIDRHIRAIGLRKSIRKEHGAWIIVPTRGEVNSTCPVLPTL